jgi:hypothetical protein
LKSSDGRSSAEYSILLRWMLLTSLPTCSLISNTSRMTKLNRIESVRNLRDRKSQNSNYHRDVTVFFYTFEKLP